MLVYTLSEIKNSMLNYKIRMVYSSEKEAWEAIEEYINLLYKDCENNILTIKIGSRSLYLSYKNSKNTNWIRFEIDCFNMKTNTNNFLYFIEDE